MNPSSNTCIIIGRLSKGDAALESHEARMVAYAQSKGFTILTRLADPDTSGDTPFAERQDGAVAMDLLRRGQARHLIFLAVDRFARNARQALNLLEELNKIGCYLHIVAMGDDSINSQGVYGKLLLTILLGVAEAELAHIRARTRDRLDFKRSQGFLTGTVPFGLDCRYHFADGFTYDSPVALWWGGEKLMPDPNAIALPVAAFSRRKAVIPKIPTEVPADDAAIDLIAAHGRPLSTEMLDNPIEQQCIIQMFEWRYGSLSTLDFGLWTLDEKGHYLDALGQRPNRFKSLKWIAAQLNARGITAKQGGPWQCGNVDSLLETATTRRLLLSSLNPNQSESSDTEQAA